MKNSLSIIALTLFVCTMLYGCGDTIVNNYGADSSSSASEAPIPESSSSSSVPTQAEEASSSSAVPQLPSSSSWALGIPYMVEAKAFVRNAKTGKEVAPVTIVPLAAGSFELQYTANDTDCGWAGGCDHIVVELTVSPQMHPSLVYGVAIDSIETDSPFITTYPAVLYTDPARVDASYVTLEYARAGEVCRYNSRYASGVYGNSRLSDEDQDGVISNLSFTDIFGTFTGICNGAEVAASTKATFYFATYGGPGRMIVNGFHLNLAP